MGEPIRVSPAALDRLTHLHPKLIDLSLGRMMRLLAACGHPEQRLPPVIHVAGTNGKGSVVAMLRACLEAAGLQVHVFTSPHLVRFNERIRIAGKIIGDEALVALLEEVEARNAGQPITFFEATTAAAFLAFSRETADVVILETGLGGRLDATNVVAKPLATVITPISMDHEQFLGNTLGAIAYEKACIQKLNVSSVLSHQAPVAREVILARAEEMGAPVSLQGRDWRIAQSGESMIYEGQRTLTLPVPNLIGGYQIHNAGAALAALEAAGFALPSQTLARGMTSIQWPARMQRLTWGPLTAKVSGGLWLDGGHNPSAGEAIATILSSWQEPVDMVCGMMANKDVEGYLRPLRPWIKRLCVVPVPVDPHQGIGGGRDPESLKIAAQSVGIANVTVAPSVSDAVEAFADRSTRRILIAGSLYLAGAVLAENG